MLSAGADGSVSMWDLDFPPPVPGMKYEVEPVVLVPRYVIKCFKKQQPMRSREKRHCDTFYLDLASDLIDSESLQSPSTPLTMVYSLPPPTTRLLKHGTQTPWSPPANSN